MENSGKDSIRRVLIVRGDLNSYSGYAYATQLYLRWLEPRFDVILGVDIHGHPAKHAMVWQYPLITDSLIPQITAQPRTNVSVLTISTPDNFRRFPGARNIGLFFWETTRLGNAAWIAKINGMDQIWLPAAFMQPMLEEEGATCRFIYVPCPVPVTQSMPSHAIPDLMLRRVPLHRHERSDNVSLAQVRESAQCLLLSTNSFIARKGFPVLADEWLGVAAEHPEVALILKVSSIDVAESADMLQECVRTLFSNVARRHVHNGYANVYVYAGGLPHETMQALNHTCDGFLTMSYGEGLGLGLFETLLSGKPVVCPRHTSFATFLPESYPYFVETEVANVGLADPVEVYPISAHWGVPLEGSLRRTMEVLLEDMRQNRVAKVVDAAVEHFRLVSRLPSQEAMG